MARLIVRFPDDEARRERRIETNFVVTTDKGLDLVGKGEPASYWLGKEIPKDVPDERPTVVATERLWTKAGRLVYRAGQAVPEDEFVELVGDAERERQVRER